MFEDVVRDLQKSYGPKVDERDVKEVSTWKLIERNQFHSLIFAEGKTKLLEIGAGTGVHGQFFQDSGMQLVCTDLYPQMVKRCQEKGLEAYVMDFLNLDFPDSSFEAVFTMNCLLHVPKNDLPGVLRAIRRVMVAGGLFYWG